MPSSTRTAVLFPGQGSQHVGMGAGLVERVPAARETFERAEEVLGIPLRRLCLEGPEEELTRTENAQPAILTVSVALWRALGDAAPSPDFVAGHSLGEFTALVVAGALSLEDGVRLVRRRGELMAAAREGTMAAVLGLDREPLEAICREVRETVGVVVIANDNAPGQLVVSGERAAVEAVAERARAAGARRVVPLKVSAAFHSPLMEAAAQAFREALTAVSFRDPRIPVISNVTARPLTRAGELAEELATQIVAPVRWTESLRYLADQGVEAWWEVGPGTVLSGLVRRTLGVRARNVSSLEDVQRVREERGER